MGVSTQNLTEAGKITVLTTFVGMFIFVFIFLLNVGNDSFKQAKAQSESATTTVTVVNTPPQWSVAAEEESGSSTTTPTNAGDVVAWDAVAIDSNGEPYFLLICSTSASPTPLSNAPPTCDTPSNQWAISATTTSGSEARAATTTQTAWAESNAWFAWICDYNVTSPRCINDYRQGTGTTSSPFSVNHRPSFSLFSDSSPADPGSVVTFYSTSSDADTDGTADTVQLIVCNLADFSTSTDSCGPGGTLSTSVLHATNASGTYTVVIPTQDQNYTAYGYIIDNHGFEASAGAQGTDSTLTVNNVAPTVTAGSISVNGGVDMSLSVESGQTTGFTLSFTAVDDNSCVNAASTSEIVASVVSIYRSGVTDTVCNGTAGAYNANNCYTSAMPSGIWNLSCTASSTTCSNPTDPSQVFTCTFPLWYIADPTDGTATSTQYSTEHWMSAIQAVDDDNATGTKATSTTGVGYAEVTSFLAFALNSIQIPYGSLEPGQQTDPIVATTTIAATGNVGLDERLSGESMCTTYSTGNDCNPSATSTIPESEQVFATSSVVYASGVALSSTTVQELELNLSKSTATSSQATKNTFWGIRVPGTISLAGDYKGENTFIAIVGESSGW